jgi:hypothetical protein
MKVIRSNKWMVYAGICFLFNFGCFSQKSIEKKEKQKAVHGLGLYGGGGFNHMSEQRYLLADYIADYKNKALDFGFFYVCSFRPTLKLRIGAEGTYMFSDINYSASYQRKSTAFHLSLPIQFQYVFNPENKVQVYFGIGISISKWINTKQIITLNDTTTTGTYANGGDLAGVNTSLEVIPMALVGVNAKLGNNFSIFLQPEYRPMVIDSKKNVRMRSLMVHLGVTYQFNQTKREKK